MSEFKCVKELLESDEKFGKGLEPIYKSILKNQQSFEKNNIELEKLYTKQASAEETPNMKKMFQEASSTMKEINATHLEFVIK